MLLASDLNAEFNSILDNGQDLGWPATNSKDFDGNTLILDADADTTIVASTDDRIDFGLAGVNLFRMDGTVATPVNGLDWIAAATGNRPALRARGSDSNFGMELQDSNSNEILALLGVASAVNEIKITNAATGVGPTMQPSGETNVPFNLLGTGTGQVQIGDAALKYPDADTKAGDALTTDGSAALTFESVPPVGSVTQYIGTTAPTGWLLLDGDTIGDSGSGATQTSADYQTLYELFWDSMADAQAPVSTGRGGSAAADWAAGKTLTMPDARGRAAIGTGTGGGLTARTHGDASLGAEDAIVVTHTHTDTFSVDSDGAHTHQLALGDGTADGVTRAVGNTNDSTASNTTTNQDAISAGAHTHALSGSVDSTGSSGTDANMPPWLALNFIVKF